MVLVYCQIETKNILQLHQKSGITLSIICHYQVKKWNSAIYMSLKYHEKRQSYDTFVPRQRYTTSVRNILFVWFKRVSQSINFMSYLCQLPIEYNFTMVFICHQSANINTKLITYLCHDVSTNMCQKFASNVLFKCHLELKNSSKVYHFCAIEY